MSALDIAHISLVFAFALMCAVFALAKVGRPEKHGVNTWPSLITRRPPPPPSSYVRNPVE